MPLLLAASVLLAGFVLSASSPAPVLPSAAPPRLNVKVSNEDRPRPRIASGPSLAVWLNIQAARMHLPIDEITYDSQDEPGLALRQEHASFDIGASYPVLRRFVETLSRERPDAAIESVDCSRDDLSSRELLCTLKISSWRRATSGAHD
ncbi:hypothetical protein [Niveibacterium terrae]|uniref:hypothetical protein n=1 Tax=Niveibacterium terrae TaxID=3373598 RepID=UPI003A90A8DF